MVYCENTFNEKNTNVYPSTSYYVILCYIVSNYFICHNMSYYVSFCYFLDELGIINLNDKTTLIPLFSRSVTINPDPEVVIYQHVKVDI